jgi:hypothetical protein
MRRRSWVCTPCDPADSKMYLVRPRRALRRKGWRRRSRPATAAPPRFWGRIGAYEAVTREGVLFLLGPEPVHPSLRVKGGA